MTHDKTHLNKWNLLLPFKTSSFFLACYPFMEINQINARKSFLKIFKCIKFSPRNIAKYVISSKFVDNKLKIFFLVHTWFGLTWSFHAKLLLNTDPYFFLHLRTWCNLLSTFISKISTLFPHFFLITCTHISTRLSLGIFFPNPPWIFEEQFHLYSNASRGDRRAHSYAKSLHSHSLYLEWLATSAHIISNLAFLNIRVPSPNL